MKIKVCGGNLSDKCWSQQDYWAWPRGHPGLPSSLVFCKPGYFHTHRASIFEVPACVEPSVPGCLLGNWLTAPKSQTKTTGQPGSPNYLLVNTALIFPMMYLYLFLYLGNQIPQIHPPDRKLLFTSNSMVFSLALSLVLDSDWQKIFIIFRIFRPPSLSWYCRKWIITAVYCVQLCIDSKKVMATDYNQYLRHWWRRRVLAPTLMALFSPSKTSVLPHFSRCLHPHFDFIGNGFLSRDLADIVMARFVTPRCCHTALSDFVTLRLLWQNLRLSTT